MNVTKLEVVERHGALFCVRDEPNCLKVIAQVGFEVFIMQIHKTGSDPVDHRTIMKLLSKAWTKFVIQSIEYRMTILDVILQSLHGKISSVL
jgi:hypothetical protein